MKVITGKVRFSYANVFEPKSVNGSTPKYSVSLIIPKSDKKTLTKINRAIETVQGRQHDQCDANHSEGYHRNLRA
jgi:hypothetical protein